MPVLIHNKNIFKYIHTFLSNNHRYFIHKILVKINVTHKILKIQ
ncbi:hypothetical protein CCYN74_320014 [Capnocytophaga cynodegmi]|uniref:Uncharacterized protein n=1 Tax=Capnocytophaga cynodegmi TaxID=28189 RepID=A0A0B7HHC7_9FLAO|nr:hypothetical protein CCYN74_320014 [Capnocytophaga cynodegmi]